MKKAFTLVELIVVITILAILATIGFVSFSGYLAGTRDINRIAQLKSMGDALELYRTRKDLPIPDDKVDVYADGTTIAYQGYIGANVLETIEYTEKGLDPKDKTYFTYMLSKNKKYYQLLTFLEESNEDELAFNSILNGIQAVDYSDRIPKTQGKKLGILIDDKNTPIQEIENITSSGFLDIVTTNDEYIGVMQDDFSITGTGAELKIIESSILVGGVRNSCKIMLEQNSKLKGKDGYYLINQQLPTKVYCDMTTDGGGWSRYVNITDEYSFQDAKDCWLSKKNIQNDSETIECFNPNRLNFVVSSLMIKEDVDEDGDTESNEIWFKKFKESYPSQIEKISTSNYKCRGGKEYMTVMAGSSAYPNNELSNISRVRLGLSFCNPDSPYREVGGRASSLNFMNYSSSSSGKGPIPGNRESTVKPTQLFIR